MWIYCVSKKKVSPHNVTIKTDFCPHNTSNANIHTNSLAAHPAACWSSTGCHQCWFCSAVESMKQWEDDGARGRSLICFCSRGELTLLRCDLDDDVLEHIQSWNTMFSKATLTVIFSWQIKWLFCLLCHFMFSDSHIVSVITLVDSNWVFLTSWKSEIL